MTLETLLQTLEHAPNTIEFNEVMSVIDANYDFTPAAFSNGHLNNDAGTNSGSCKIFSFGQLHGLSQEQTLACFGSYYRDDVLNHPTGNDHGNIRNFIQSGWQGIQFTKPALRLKA